MEAILLKALAKTPDDRFQSVREMIQALAQASDQVKEAAEGGDIGATAVLDLAAINPDDMLEAPTAVMDAAAGPAETAAVSAPSAEAEAPAGKRNMLLIGAGVAVAVVIAAVAAVAVLGGGDGDEDPVAPAAGAASAPAQAAAAPQAPSGAGGAAAAVAGATAVAEETAAPAAEPTITPEPTAPPLTIDEVHDLIDQAQSNVNRVREIRADDVTNLVGQIERAFVDRAELETITRGFFNRSAIRDQLYVVSDGNRIAAAYMAGVQQRLVNVSDLRQSARQVDDDQLRAVSALIVGDVTEVVTGYIGTHFNREQAAELQEPIPDNKLLTAPDVVQKANRFQRREGVNFIAALFGEAGWDGVNAAYENPPLSTEQVLHPEKYLAGEEPHLTEMPNIAADLGRGWEQVSSNTMGEFLIRTYLEEHLDNNQAEEAAAGWGGDRYALFIGPEAQRLLMLQIRWDNVSDSKEFFDAYRVFASFKTQGQEAQTGNVGETAWRSVTPDETVFLGQQGPAIFLIIGPDTGTVETALNLFLAWLQQAATP